MKGFGPSRRPDRQLRGPGSGEPNERMLTDRRFAPAADAHGVGWRSQHSDVQNRVMEGYQC